ncbi:MAG TPA: sugar ABC transporter substrate-binding protein [Candidatus Limnocylindrales bacterium]|nr:sugar ABC transporter substrate-binding protein [Candidatus Limnocylindrales bacterium]
MSFLSKSKKKGFKLGVAALLLSLVFTIAVVGAGCPPAAPEVASPYRTDKIVIGFTPPDITGVFKTATDFFIESAANARAAGIHVEIIARSPATHTAYADQVAIIEDFIALEVDVIAISPADVAAVTPALQKANAAGIPIIVVNLLGPFEGVEVASYVGFDNFTAGAVTAYSVLDYFGGPGVLGAGPMVEVTPLDSLDLAWWEALYADVDPATINARGILLEGVPGSYFSDARLRGFRSVLEQFPGVVELQPVVGTNWNRALAMAATEDALVSFAPGEMDFVWGMSSEIGLGAMLAVEAAGRQEDVKVFNQGGTSESMSRIREGRLVAEAWHGFPEWGWFGVKHAVMAVLGLEPPATLDVRPRILYVDNLVQFTPVPYLPEIDWEAILQEAGL